MRRCLFLIPLLVSSAACSSAEDVVEAVGIESASLEGAAQEETSQAVSIAHDDAEGGGVFDFDYDWPAEVTAEAGLAAQLRGEADELHTAARAEWREMVASAPEDCASCARYGQATTWKVVADLPRFLSLSVDRYLYSGGAHGNYGHGGLVWDRKEQAGLAPIDVFRSPQGFADAVRSRYCSALDAMREERRGMEVDETGDDLFDTCPAIEELTVLLGSSDGQRFNRIGLVADPYVAGPYAEGTYEITLPVDTAILDAVRPAYQGAFALAPRKTAD